MYRGTTPAFTFTLPIDTADISLLSVAFKQNGELKFDKSKDDVTLEDKKIVVTLSEEETLSLDPNYPILIQLRVGVGNSRLASQIFKVNVNDILKDGVLQ